MLFRRTVITIFLICSVSIPVFSSKGDLSVLLPKKGTNGKWGYADAGGNFRIGPNYTIAFEFKEGLAAVSLYNKFGYIDATGRPVISLQYDGASGFSEGLAAVMIYDQRQNKKWGYIDKTGQFVIFPRFDKATDFSDGKAVVSNDTIEFVINRTGEIIKEKAAYNIVR